MWGGADRGAGLSSHLVAGPRQPGARLAPHPLGHAPESAKRLRSSPGSDPPARGSRPWPVHGRGASAEHQRPPRNDVADDALPRVGRTPQGIPRDSALPMRPFPRLQNRDKKVGYCLDSPRDGREALHLRVNKGQR